MLQSERLDMKKSQSKCNVKKSVEKALKGDVAGALRRTRAQEADNVKIKYNPLKGIRK